MWRQVVLLLLLILLTRGLSLRYQMAIHPDEYKFARATDSLMNALLEPDAEFVEVKEYPEGAYLYHLPFHLMGRLLEWKFGLPYNMGLCGRVSSVVWFCLAVLLGVRLLTRYMGGSKAAVWLYGLSMCFSLFFLEHSRYGTGDMISLFLIMLVITLTARSAEERFAGWLPWLTFFICGSLAAVKYPLVLFVLIPLVMLWYCIPEKPSRKLLYSLLGLALVFLGLLLFSPKAIGDLGYFARVIQREMDAYVYSGTTYEAGGLLNHIASLTVYTLFYSDFPLAILLTAAAALRWLSGFVNKLRRGERMPAQEFMFHMLIPALAILFFAYNLFPKLLVFRTYTPFFGLAVLYGSLLLGQLWEKGKKQQTVIALLCCLMVLRGAGLVYVMSSQQRVQGNMMAQIAQAVDESWEKTIFLKPYEIPLPDVELKSEERITLLDYVEKRGGDPSMSPGTLLITGAYEYLVNDYMLPVLGSDETSEKVRNEAYQWEFFKEINQCHYVGQSYPDWYYYLFGGWIRGGTLSATVIPCNQVYYFPG